MTYHVTYHVTYHAQHVFPDTCSSVFHLNKSRLFDENNPFYGNVALFKNSKSTSRKTVIIERPLSLSLRLTTVQCLKAHLNFLIIEFFFKMDLINVVIFSWINIFDKYKSTNLKAFRDFFSKCQKLHKTTLDVSPKKKIALRQKGDIEIYQGIIIKTSYSPSGK